MGTEPRSTDRISNGSAGAQAGLFHMANCAHSLMDAQQLAHRAGDARGMAKAGDSRGVEIRSPALTRRGFGAAPAGSTEPATSSWEPM